MSYNGEERRNQPTRCGMHEEWLTEIKADIKDIKHILTGNGNPSHGLAFKVKSLEEWKAGASRVIWVVVLGAVSGFTTLGWKIAEAYYRGSM